MIRIITICLFFFHLIFTTNAQNRMEIIHKLPKSIIECKWENTNNRLELVFYNKDYCPYYVSYSFGRTDFLDPGKNIVYSTNKDSKSRNSFKDSWKYRYWRGKFLEKFNPNRTYALPVANGETVSWEQNLNELVKTMEFSSQLGDTIYAVRNGIACETTHPLHLLVHHADNTFAAYFDLAINFIKPGIKIKTGQPIGISNKNSISISFFFLDKNKFGKDLRSSGYPYSHFIPIFRTTEGDLKLEPHKDYEALIDDDLIMQEMNKREQKAYLKNKQ